MNPMETAPHDESWVLLDFGEPTISHESGYCIAFWSNDPDPGWFASEASSNPVTDFDEPIGWWPLPIVKEQKG